MTGHFGTFLLSHLITDGYEIRATTDSKTARILRTSETMFVKAAVELTVAEDQKNLSRKPQSSAAFIHCCQSF